MQCIHDPMQPLMQSYAKLYLKSFRNEFKTLATLIL